ncbi:MAG: PAS domain S-box protein [Anaerolineae bacterium]
MNETSPAARHEQNYNLPRHIQHLIDSVNDVLFITNEAGYFTYVNSQIMRLFGYTPDDVLGQHFSTYLHPNCRSQITDYYVRQFKERIPESRREFEIVTYSGEARWIEQNVTLIIEGDRVVGCCGIARDISQRKQMEDKLNESEQLFRSIIEKTEDIIFIKDQDGRHVMINPAFSKSLNLPLDSVLDKTDVEVFGKETGDRYRERDLQVMTSGQTHIFDDTSDREGIHKDYSIVKFPLRSHSGEVRGVVGIGRDITARKQIENAIRISEERFRNLAEMTAALVFVCRQKNQLVYVNPALIEATGYTLNELLTKSFIELVHPNDRQFLLEWEHYRPEDVSATRHELRLKRKDESDCWIDIALKAVVMADTTVIVGTGLDITERQRHESQLRDNQLYIAAVPDAVYVYDFTEQRVIFSNKKISEMLGYDAREVELFDENFLPRFVHPDDQRIFLAQNKDLQKISDGEFLEFTFRMQGADATWHWINVKNRVFKRSPAGKVTQALGVARNVTEQKITEEYLRKSEAQAQQFHEYLKALNEINIELSETESFDDLCRRAIELGRNRLRFDRLGLLMLDENSGEVIGTYGTDVDGNLRDERAIRIAKKNNFDWVLDALAEKRRVKVWHDVALYDNWQVVGRGWNAMAVLLSDKGVIGWLAADNLTRHEPLQDYQLELLSLYAATLEHICIRKRSEDALRTTQMRYQAVIQDQTELICRYLPDTRLTFVNDAMCRYFGRTHEEMLGKSFLADVPVEFREMITDQIQRSIQTGQPFTYQHSVRFPNGRLRWQEWTDRPIFDKNGQLLEFQSMGRDIEERRRNEAERNEYISRLEIIRQVDVELTEQLDINYVLRIAADAAVRISQARAGIIHLLEGNVLRVAQVAGNFPPSVPGQRLHLIKA